MRELTTTLRYLADSQIYLDLENVDMLCLNDEASRWPWRIRTKAGADINITSQLAIRIMNALKLYRGAP